MSTWKKDFGSGLIILGPILATLYLVSILYGILAGYTPSVFLTAETLEPILIATNEQTRERVAGVFRVLIFLAMFGALLLMSGYAMRTALGRLVEESIDEVANRIPGLRLVYNASKTAAETTFGDTQSLQTPVKVETWMGLRMTAFKTGKTTAEGREVLFIPTSPNITTGFVVEAASDDVVEIDETVEEALTRVVSAGFGDATHSEKYMEEGIAIEVIDEMTEEKRDS
ncbi:DUF502 domain-containing protein [Halomontanus rarus]|uniref:DUF502 domain-containing protein n=1 Tax=Halomontanus rarus TaxID=3034020 RepID=UPI0023E8E0A6|nr:DUF502 domain-containing protein [Halovivax sp. TS33]